MPLQTGMGHVGTLGIAVRGDAPLGDDEEARLRQFADAAASLIERTRLLRQDSDHARGVAALADAVRTLRSAAATTDVGQSIVRAIPFSALVPGHGPVGGREAVEGQLLYLDRAGKIVAEALDSAGADEVSSALAHAFPEFRLRIVLPALVDRFRRT